MNKFRALVVSVIIFSGCHSHSASSANSTGEVGKADSVKHVANAKPIDKGVIVDTVQCMDEPTQKYAIYLPTNYSTAKKWPIMYFFDPHGVGNLPLRIYKELAEKYGYIIAGTYGSKNGMQIEASERAGNAMMTDTRQRLSIDADRIYAFGFSGGARVATSMATDIGGFAGVVACGGGFAKASPNISEPFACMMFVGDRDFNYIELKQLDKQLDPTPLPHQLEVYHGKHQWPPVVNAEEAFQWFNLYAMRLHTMPKNDSLINVVEKKFKAEITKWSNPKNEPQLYFVYKKMLNFLRDLTETGAYSAAYQELANSDNVKKYLANQQTSDQQEAGLQKEFISYVSDKNDNWWQSTIKDFRVFIQKDSNSPVALQDQRLLNFMSLVTYMSAVRAMSSSDVNASTHFLDLYKLVDPTNPEHDYLYAELYANGKQDDKAITCLEDAVKLGFSDARRMENDASFTSLRSKPEYKELLKKMSSAKEKIDVTQ